MFNKGTNIIGTLTAMTENHGEKVEDPSEIHGNIQKTRDFTQKGFAQNLRLW